MLKKITYKEHKGQYLGTLFIFFFFADSVVQKKKKIAGNSFILF